MEKEDADALQTALRECHEEIGVPEEKVSILGVLSDIYIPLSNFNITPIVGTTLQLPDFILSQDEVDRREFYLGSHCNDYCRIRAINENQYFQSFRKAVRLF